MEMKIKKLGVIEKERFLLTIVFLILFLGLDSLKWALDQELV